MTEEELTPIAMSYALGIPCQVFNNHRGPLIWIDMDDSWDLSTMYEAIQNSRQQFRIKPNDSRTD